jgi:peptidoglycan/xylan/chitin deacetylase (PgdA/CDA1 family)
MGGRSILFFVTRAFWSTAGLIAMAALLARPVTASSTAVFTRGPAPCHALAFTFDLCPVREGSGFDAPLVKFLVDHKVHATFFASGSWIAAHDAQMHELLSHPFFEIGTHGQMHAHMTSEDANAQAAEIRGPVATLAKRFAVRATLFRPPYGEYNDETVRQADAAGQTVVMWSIVSGDPDPKLPADRIVADVVSRAKNGSVIIFHANGRGWHDDEVVPEVYRSLIESKHFAADTVSELRGCTGQQAR